MITVEEFVEKMHSELAEFADWWHGENYKNSENFPNKMNDGDWFEQFLFVNSDEYKGESE